MATDKEYDALIKDIKAELDPLYFLEDNESDTAHNDRMMTAITTVINKIIHFKRQHNP